MSIELQSGIHAAVSTEIEDELSYPRRKPTVRVLHVINGEDYAGAERVQDRLALQLPTHGFEVGFACLKPGRFARVRQSQGAPLYEFPMRNRFDVRPVLQMARLIREESYE